MSSAAPAVGAQAELFSVSKEQPLDAAPETALVIQAHPNDGGDAPAVSPEQMSALKQAMPRYTQDGGVLMSQPTPKVIYHHPRAARFAYASQQVAAAAAPLPPSDVLLLVHDPNQSYNSSQSSSWHPTASINKDLHPLRISTADPSKVTFVQQSSALRLLKQSQENLESMRQTNERIKKRVKLTADLQSNKEAHVAAKRQGGLSEIGALAIERDRIEEELAAMKAEDKAVEKQTQRQLQQQQAQQQSYMEHYGTYPMAKSKKRGREVVKPPPQEGSEEEEAAEGEDESAKVAQQPSPSWDEQVTVYRTVDLPFGYCKFDQGDSVPVYNIVKVQQIDLVALPMEQVVTISKSAQ